MLANTVRAEQQVAPERLFVRVVDRGVESVVLSNNEGWDPTKLEIVSATLADGTLVQVGKSTEARDDLLARFRATLGFVTLLIVVDRADRRLAGDPVGAVSDPPADRWRCSGSSGPAGPTRACRSKAAAMRSTS